MNSVPTSNFARTILVLSTASASLVLVFSLWFALQAKDDKAIVTWALLIVGLAPAPLAILIAALATFVARFKSLAWVAVPFALFPMSIALLLAYVFATNAIYLIRN